MKYLRTSIRTSEAEIAEKIRTSRLSEKKGVLIKKMVYWATHLSVCSHCSLICLLGFKLLITPDIHISIHYCLD